MARRPPQRPSATLAVVFVAVVALYGAMAGTGHHTPKLGLDLQGGTSVILSPKSAPNTKVTSGQLSSAVDIIRQRVNGLGVSESEVVRQGNNVVVSVPGKGRDDVLKAVGQTAFLTFREIQSSAATNVPPGSNAKPLPSTSPSPTTAPTTAPTTTPKTRPTTAPTGSARGSAAPPRTPAPSASASAHGRAASGALTGRAAATPTPKASPKLTATPTPTQNTLPSTAPAPGGSTKEADQTAPTAAERAQFAALDCSKNGGRPATVDDDIHHYVVACDRAQPIKYLLKPAQIVGTDVSNAAAGLEQNSQGVVTGNWVVNLTFKDSAISKVQRITGRLFSAGNQPLAITLDGVVQSAPATNGQLGKNVQISGGQPAFTEKEAKNLANSLKYGSLPVTFTPSSVETVSATLGTSSLHAGLLAGVIGLALVLLYVLLYYRALSVVTVASLAVSGLLVYASVVLLGQLIGFTLTLSGIAGLIVSVGITADSFVVFFERVKDELHEGRSPRQAVEYGWVRARRTIISADVVSILAALILYEVSIGSVRGFAFTLGLSTLLDVFVVMLFTKPAMSLLIRYRTFSTGRFSGLATARAVPTTTRGV